MKTGAIVSLFLLCPALLSAAFIPDEFDGAKLKAQWRWNDSIPPGSTVSLDGGVLKLKCKPGADLGFTEENYCHVQQEAPSGSEWEVVTKLNQYDPTQQSAKQPWQRAGLVLRQDKNHWIAISLTCSGNGERRIIEGLYEFDPQDTRTKKDDRFKGVVAGYEDIWNDASKPVWLKISKTRSGYVGYGSIDGEDWIPVTPILRNPEDTKTGFMTREDLRVFASGGPGQTSGTADAQFDFLRISPVEPAPQGYKDDDFSSPSLNTSTWSTFRGLWPGTIEVKDGMLKLVAGAWQDVWENLDRHMFVYQDAPVGDKWALTVKCSPLDLRRFEPFNGYGLQIWQDQNSWILITNVRDSRSQNMVQVARQMSDGSFKEFHKYETTLPPYLRIVKSGTKYIPMTSTDGKKWTGAPPGGFVFPNGLQNAQVRVFSKRINDKPMPPLEIQIDSIVKEDPGETLEFLPVTDEPLKWRALQQGLTDAQQTQKPLMAFSYLPDVPACSKYDRQIFIDGRVRALVNSNFIPVRVDLRFQKDAAMKLGIFRAGVVAFADSTGKPMKSLIDEPDLDTFLKEAAALVARKKPGQ